MNNFYFRRDLLRTVYRSAAFLIVLCCSVSFGFTQEKPLYTPEEFTKLIRDFSEPTGFFSSDNWVSNELSYLDVIELLKDTSSRGGAYIGVGPEQNFTYITAVKPDIAFIVDIRQMNRMQHLYYKVLFELAETRAEFLSLLLCKPLDPKKEKMLKQNHNIDSLVIYFYQTSPEQKLRDKIYKQVIEILAKKYSFQLTISENSDLTYVMDAFYNYNIDITYNGLRRSWYPTLGQILRSQSSDGKQKNPFYSDEDYAYLRKMHRENRIIPITGNFAGTKAFSSIAAYLTAKKITVSAIYVSNVEQYLLRDYRDWNQWVSNVKALPITDKSVVIRWTHNGSGMNQLTRLQWVKIFIKNCDENKYFSYADLTYFDYIK